MVRIKKDEFGNIEEISLDLWDMMIGNDIKVRGNSAIIEYHGLFGIGRSKHIIPMKKVIPTKQEVKMKEVMRQDVKQDTNQDTNQNLTVTIGKQKIKASELSPELREKLGISEARERDYIKNVEIQKERGTESKKEITKPRNLRQEFIEERKSEKIQNKEREQEGLLRAFVGEVDKWAENVLNKIEGKKR
jgi:hypothetical protein